MDECLPPIIRDNKIFMLPFYYYAYRGKRIKQAMNFKKLAYSMSSEDYANFYSHINTISRNRKTDLNNQCIKYIISIVKSFDSGKLVDIGCAGGYLLKMIHEANPFLELSGYDIKKFDLPGFITLNTGDITDLPYPDNHFDIVTCCHTIEHLINIKESISEIIRIAKKDIIIVTPCQRPYFYTLDEHVNFFNYAEQLTSLFKFTDFKCIKLGGDWLYHASVNKH